MFILYGMKISFHGAAQGVTGACHLLESGQTKILVDCGLFQGCDECADLNFEPFQFDPKTITALIVTHSHIDHIGRIPKLVRDGFRGAIYSTAATRDLARVMLDDALFFVERGGKALYEAADIEQALSQWTGVPYAEAVHIGGVSIRLRNAGHILGSALVEIDAEGKKLLFTGDLGNAPSLLLPDPDVVRGVDYLIIESAYGSRIHESRDDRELQLERAVEDVAARKGTLMIPAFATERTQEILFTLNQKIFFKRIPEMPVFVDSPLAMKVTEIFERHPGGYRQEIKDLFREHPHLFQFKKLKFTESVQESKAINDVPQPKVIIAGSGMMNGGRILHHMRRYISDKNSILLIVGFQVAGSLGRRLIDGERSVKMFGEEIPVYAEIRKIHGFSAHADNPQLFDFISQNRDALRRVFVVQGEEAQALHLAVQVRDHLGIKADAPILHESFEL